ncbi:MAG: asparagine synthase C-terminal domain-containing protein, partial [Ignavibacteria bacterium]|nr:asparagine synthase C-terminal domain-containing protein [Ignavibacteria bacterium]
KPFYYYIDKNCLIFSSEIKAVLKAKNISEANHGKVFDYLAYGYKTNNGDTFFININELKPSHSILTENSEMKILKYFDLNEVSETGINFKEASDNLNDLLDDSVRIRFRSDVPVSILLSGGLDSGIIASITNSLIEKHELTEHSVSSFSAVFPGYKYDESEYINEISNKCSNITANLLHPDLNFLKDSIDKFVYGMGEPVFSTTSFAHYMLMKEIRNRNIKVILNGQGADEAWCGYGRYISGYYLSDMLLKNPGKFVGEFNDVSDKMKFSRSFIFLQMLKSFLSRRTGSYLRSAYGENVFNCLTSDFRKNNFCYFKNPEYGVLSANKLTEFMKYNIQYQGFNQILHYEDHSAMQNSVEIRSPFIDYRLMTLAFSLPVSFKFEHGITKRILRELFKKRLPDSVINNHIKTGFMTPFDDWLNNASGNMFANEIFNSESFKNISVWDSGKIKKMFGEKSRLPDFPFWRIINTVLWKNAYGITNL